MLQQASVRDPSWQCTRRQNHKYRGAHLQRSLLSPEKVRYGPQKADKIREKSRRNLSQIYHIRHLVRAKLFTQS